MNEARTIILLHGAWHGSWCWQFITPQLERHKLNVICPDLPGHHPSAKSENKITLKAYVQFIVDIIEQLNTPDILVGHSMAGMVIAQVAELRPNAIDKLIFLNAYLPVAGDSIFSLTEEFSPNSKIAQAMSLADNKLSYSLNSNDFLSLFYHQSNAEKQSLAIKHYQRQSSLPLSNKVSLSDERYGQVKKVVICSLADKVLPAAMQKHMLARQACDEYVQIEGDHCPFFSLPDTLSALLCVQ